ncbi:MAG: TonB-dependent receptor [Gammaproteobacteria bacterium]|nr:TonB-dependent receptor [Gammaproteobacteria bacterium]
MKPNYKLILGFWLLVTIIQPSFAQEAGYKNVIEEITVTARKRVESLSEAPVSVKAFTSNEIAAAGIKSAQDFIDLTPNVTLVQTQNAGNSFLTLRGVSQARNSDMSAAVLIDGVLMSNPTQLNQALFDIEQIEVLRGPQGALYGRNAIGGAITISTREPGEETDAKAELGIGSGSSKSLKGAISGSLNEDSSLRYRLSGSFYDTDGFIDNTYLGEKIDPFKDTSARLRVIWDASDTFSADARISTSKLKTSALYFVIGAEADNTSIDVMTNNPGYNERNFTSASLKLDWDLSGSTFTSITAYDDVDEILYGDQFNFLPREHPWNYFNNEPSGFADYIRYLTGDALTDLSQNQYLEVESLSQEFRLTSNTEEGPQWIIGAYFISTDRYISTGNQIDRGLGVYPVKKEFRPSVFVDPSDPSPQLNILADGQDNFAWAVFGQISYDLSDKTEASFSLRYDDDERENTTLTPALYNTSGLNLMFGEKRKESWDSWQPKFTLRHQLNENTTTYADISRGFRSGGFNQTGVGEAVPTPGVSDVFEAQIADTYEVGIKHFSANRRVTSSIAIYKTEFENAYFFLFDPGTSTQNLGTIPEVDYTGAEIEISALVSENWSFNAGLGLTDSEILKAADASHVGNQAPLVSENTMNLGTTYSRPIGNGSLDMVLRADYAITGDTWWEPSNVSKRSEIKVLDLRASIKKEDSWALTFWAKNALDEEYNSEFSPGPAAGYNFLWPALPARFGIDFTVEL